MLVSLALGFSANFASHGTSSLQVRSWKERKKEIVKERRCTPRGVVWEGLMGEGSEREEERKKEICPEA